jgi:hypothetical protein
VKDNLEVLTQNQNTPLSPAAHTAPAAPAKTWPSARERGDSSKKSNPEDELVERLVDEAVAARPTWSRGQCRKVLREQVAERGDRELVAAAWRRCIADPATTSPGRFPYPLVWWETPGAAPVSAEPVEWCGTCESADYRWVEQADGRYARCQQCNPAVVVTVGAATYLPEPF